MTVPQAAIDAARRVERIGDATLLLGDCLDILPHLGPVDAVVTDPPYGIGENSKRAASRGILPSAKWRNPKPKDYGDDAWDTEPADPRVIEWILAHSDWQVIFGGNYYALPPTTCWLIWDKKNGDTDFADCEMAWTNLDKAVRKIDWLWSGFKKQVPEERFHLTQKPLGVMEWSIGHLPTTVRTVCDPYMGSGTTGAACVKRGLEFVGIERDEHHFGTACRRIELARRQPDMFVAPRPAPAVQEPLFKSEAT